MSYTTTSGQERATRLAVVMLLHAGMGALLLSMGGYKALQKMVAPIKPTFVEADPPPVTKPVEPKTTLDPVEPKIPRVVIDIDKPVAPNSGPPVTMAAGPETPTGPVQSADSTNTGAGPVDPPVHHDVVRTLASNDPRYNDMLQPNYPGAARAIGAEGRVELEVIIGIDGRVMEARLIKSSGNNDLDSAALRHAKKYWRFKPATEDGKPVISSVKRAILFKLDIERG